jgi:hypothetical protein
MLQVSELHVNLFLLYLIKSLVTVQTPDSHSDFLHPIQMAVQENFVSIYIINIPPSDITALGQFLFYLPHLVEPVCSASLKINNKTAINTRADLSLGEGN